MCPMNALLVGIAVFALMIYLTHKFRQKCEDALDPIKEWDRIEAQREMNERVFK